MLYFLLSCLYFFLPAYLANMTPPIAKKMGVLKFLDKPVDFGKKIGEKRILGSHKTWRGVVAGIAVGVFVLIIQTRLYSFSFIKNLSFFNYQKINPWQFGLLISGGAILGDLINSFIKRRFSVKPGGKFIPFDQTNYVIGSAVCLTLFGEIDIDILVWTTLFFTTFFLHIIVNRIGYHLNIHQAKW